MVMVQRVGEGCVPRGLALLWALPALPSCLSVAGSAGRDTDVWAPQPRLPQRMVIWCLLVYEGRWEPKCGLSTGLERAKPGFGLRSSESCVYKSGSMLSE